MLTFVRCVTWDHVAALEKLLCSDCSKKVYAHKRIDCIEGTAQLSLQQLCYAARHVLGAINNKWPLKRN